MDMSEDGDRFDIDQNSVILRLIKKIVKGRLKGPGGGRMEQILPVWQVVETSDQLCR